MMSSKMLAFMSLIIISFVVTADRMVYTVTAFVPPPISASLQNPVPPPSRYSPDANPIGVSTPGFSFQHFNAMSSVRLRPSRYDGLTTRLAAAKDDDEDDDDIDLGDQDWRAFRAKLVMGESSSSSSSTTSLSSASSIDTSSTKSGKTAARKQQPEAQTISDTSDNNDDDSIDETNVDDLDGIGALFSQVKVQESFMTPLDPSQWAYDSGTVIEQGAVILGGVEQEFSFALRQQYFHKAAILVLDHEESTFTKGIILNRPTDLTLDDDINPGVKWRVWHGGDVQGLNSDMPDLVCLHTLQNSVVTKASIPVMNDIQWTTFDAAKKLVKAGVAEPTDFWVFCGYAGWGPGQLLGELERKSWYMVATDAKTLLQELARLSAGADPRDAGLDTWALLMNMIGRTETAKEHTGDFDDLMLKEWALKNLLSTEAGGGAGTKRQALGGMSSSSPREFSLSDSVDRLIKKASKRSGGDEVKEGTIVRAAPVDRSPFLLEDQELHKSIVLVISEGDDMTVGVILNRPGAKGLEIRIQEKETGKSRELKVPLRYGGQYAVKGSEPLLWLHCNSSMKAANIGDPIGNMEGIWKCTAKDVMTAVGQGIATPGDFLVVAGVSVWAKHNKNGSQGLGDEIRQNRFEVVPEWRVQDVWNELAKQEILSEVNLKKNLLIASEAWMKGTTKNGAPVKRNGDSEPDLPIGGLGEGFDEDDTDDTLVFKSNVKVSKLSDDALRAWVATFLLGAPSVAE